MKNIDLKKWEFDFQQRDRHPILMADQWCRALWHNLAEELKLDVGGLDYFFISNGRAYVKIDQKKLVISKLREAIQSDVYLDNLLSRTMEIAQEFHTFAQKVASEIDSINGHQALLEKWQEFDAISGRFIPWFYIPWYLSEENMLSDRVKDELFKHKSEIEKITDFNDALMTLIFPVKENEFQKEQRAFCELVECVDKESQQFEDLAQDYVNEFGWMKTFVELPIDPLTTDDLKARLSQLDQSKFIEEYKLQSKKKEEMEEVKKNLSIVLSDNEKLWKYVDQSRELAFTLTASVDLALRSYALLLPFYKKIAVAIGISQEDWLYLTHAEICSSLERQKASVSSEEIKNRKSDFVYLMEEGRFDLMTSKEAEEFASQVNVQIDSTDQSVTQLVGKPVSPGSVIGKVIVATTPERTHTLESGDILVCTMTSPDYIMAMKKAGAIVTDEGGLLCHAAIVSRELGKPCVIGTKNATQVLKDGMMVEVDANTGIVRILA